MKVKLYFTTQFTGSIEKEIKVPDNSTDEYIESLFPKCIGIEYDDNCSYERME